MKRIIVFLALLSFVIISCEKSTEPELTYGNLFVNSDPGEIAVFVDGKNTGKKTPVFLKDVVTGHRQLMLQHEYFQDWKTSVVIEEGKTDSVFAQLTHKPITLIINSEPAGAKIIVNEISMEMFTPDTIYNPGPGTYKIDLRKQGYFPYDEIVQLLYGDTKSVFSSLVHSPDFSLAYTHGNNVYYSRLDGTDLRIIASDYKNVGHGLMMSPDGRYIAYGNGSGIRIINNQGNEETLINHTNRADDFTWSHDSRYLVWGVYIPGIYRYDTQTKEVKRIYATPGFRYSHCPVYSPDDQLIAFVRHEWETQCTIFVMKADGSSIIKTSYEFLTEYDEDVSLCWAGDSLLYFTTHREKGKLWGLYTFHLSENSVKRVTPRAPYLLSTSPDKRLYAFTIYPGLHVAPIGIWEPEPFTDYWVSRIAWSLDSDAMLVRKKDGVFWLTLSGLTHQIVSFQNNYRGGLSIGR